MGLEDINKVNPYELSDSAHGLESGDTLPNQKNDKNTLKPGLGTLDNKNIDDTGINSQEKQLDGFFSELTKINTGEKTLRKNNINTFVDTKKIDIDAFVASPAYMKLLQEARNGGYNTQDKSKAMKMNFALQVYARQELGDKNIAIDGQAGPQTLAVLRFIQSEGIAGDVVNVQITEEQQKKFAEYRTYRGSKLLERARLVSESLVSPIVPPSENSLVPKTNSESRILSNNSGIESSINDLPKPSTNRIQAQGPILDPFEIENIVTTNIKEPIIAQSYINYLTNNRKGNLPKGVSPDLDKSISNAMEQKSLEKKQSVSALCQRESYLSCIKGFEGLLRNFTSDPVQQKSWLDSLNKQSQSDFNTGTLSLKINIGGEDIRFIYDTEKGEILANALIHKDPKTNEISTRKESKFSTIIEAIPTRHSLEKDMQSSINTKIQTNLKQNADFQDAINIKSKLFNTKLITNINLNSINKVVESNYIDAYIFGWMQKTDPSGSYRRDMSPKNPDNLYKICDIFCNTTNTYTHTKLQQLRKNLPDLQNIFQEYKQGNIVDTFWSTYIGPSTVAGFASNKPDDSGLYLLCKNMVDNPKAQNPIINLNTMKKMIDYDHASDTHGFGNPSHNVLAEIDTHNASVDADKLLESAYA